MRKKTSHADTCIEIRRGIKSSPCFFVMPDVPSVMAVPSVSWLLFSDDHDASLLWLLSHILVDWLRFDYDLLVSG